MLPNLAELSRSSISQDGVTLNKAFDFYKLSNRVEASIFLRWSLEKLLSLLYDDMLTLTHSALLRGI